MAWSPNTLTDPDTSEEKSSDNGEKDGGLKTSGLFARQIHDTLTHESAHSSPRRVERFMPLLSEVKADDKPDDEKIILFDRHIVEQEEQKQKHAAEIVEDEHSTEADTESAEDDEEDEEDTNDNHQPVKPAAKPVARPVVPRVYEQVEWPQSDDAATPVHQVKTNGTTDVQPTEAPAEWQHTETVSGIPELPTAEQVASAPNAEQHEDYSAEQGEAEDPLVWNASQPSPQHTVRYRRQPSPPPASGGGGGGGGRPPVPPPNLPPASPNFGPPNNPNQPPPVQYNMGYGPPAAHYNQYNQYNQVQQPSLAELIPRPRPRAEHVRAVDGLARLGVVLGYFAGRRRDRKLDNKIENNSRETKANFAGVETNQLRFDQQQQRQDRDIRQLQYEQQQAAAARTPAEQTPLTAVGPQNEAMRSYVPQNPNTMPNQQRAEQFRQAKLEALPPIEGRSEQTDQLNAAEQAAEVTPDLHLNSSAWHNIAVKNGREVQGAIEYGRSFQEERKQEVLPDRPTANAGAAGLSMGAFGAQPQSPYAPGYPPNDGLPSGMTAPSLPQGLPTHSDPQHQLPQHTKKSGAPGLAFWIMLAVIIAAFFAAALI